MTPEVRPMEESDRDRLVALHAEAFQVPAYRLVRQQTLPLDRGWVITERGRVVGGLRADLVGQLFGGRSVPSAIITAVKIAPEARGRGFGRILMRETAAQLASRGVALSSLYPSSPALYRSAGWETAGLHVRWRVSAGLLPHRLESPLEPLEGENAALRQCYRRFAERHAGLVDRDDTWWAEWILDPWLDRPTSTFVLREGDELRGYLVYGLSPDPRADLPYAAQLACTDFVWLDPGAARSMLAFAGAQGPLLSSMTWPGSPVDPLSAVLQAPIAASTTFHWMLRVLRPDAALSTRGYATDVRDRIALRVVDDTVPTNTATYVLDVAEGRASVSVAEVSPDVEIDIRGLAAVYTGWLRVADAHRLALLRNATPGLVSRLDAVFRGPVPWMAELV